jgi:hypothetical protein
MRHLLSWLLWRLHRQTIRKSPIQISGPYKPKAVRLHKMRAPIVFLEAWTGFHIGRSIQRQRTDMRGRVSS